MKYLEYNSIEEKQELLNFSFGPITQMDIVRYTGASGDFNPIHADPSYAVKVGLDSNIAHGMYLAGHMSRLYTKVAHPKQLLQYSLKFRNMTRINETILYKLRVKRKMINEKGEKQIILYAEASNTEGDVKVSGEFTLIAQSS